ncbi:hypothetical protein HNY73_011739, partial [Argiope bruennichi]
MDDRVSTDDKEHLPSDDEHLSSFWLVLQVLGGLYHKEYLFLQSGYCPSSRPRFAKVVEFLQCRHTLGRTCGFFGRG